VIADKSDPEMQSLAVQEKKQQLEILGEAEKELVELAFQSTDEHDSRNAVLEIRQGQQQAILCPSGFGDVLTGRDSIEGTGGDEAGLFAEELFKMYQTFAIEQGWKCEIIQVSPANAGGFKVRLG